MVEEKEILAIVDKHKEYRDLVFQRGYLITTCDYELNNDTLFQKWNLVPIGVLKIWHHPNTSVFIKSIGKTVFFLIGHAYNPFSGSFLEDSILEELSKAYSISKNEYQDYISSLSGVFLLGFIVDDSIHFQLDPVAMSATYIGNINGELYITSHCNIVAHIEPLKRNPFVDELVSYKYYKFFGAGLPGDLSPYEGLSRVQCNFEYECNRNRVIFRRVFPYELMHREYSDNIDIISIILEKNMELIQKKWGEECVLGLTGGKDSTTSLAGAHGVINSITTFSYVSCEGERIDAEAAERIAKAVHVNHYTIPIELTTEELNECKDIGSIIEFNMGSIGRLKEKEIRKRVYFFHHPSFKTEIKSWVDEIGRARLHKRYLKKSFPRSVRPRYLTTIYKFFGLNRRLVYKTDRAFSNYLEKYYTPDVFDIIPWWDLLYWEYSWGASEALHLVNEHMLTANVTIPFNNRKLLSAMLDIDLKSRIDDQIQNSVIENLLPEINQTGISVKDYGWNRKREIAEKAYWVVNTHLPF